MFRLRCAPLALLLPLTLLSQQALGQSTPLPHSAPAHEEAGSPPESDWQTAAATRRSGFTFGLVTGFGITRGAGYPNNYAAIGKPEFESIAAGSGSASDLWLGGALTDWFTFGLGATFGGYSGDKLQMKGSGFVFHLEAFPLFSWGGRARDLGLFADFGTGKDVIERKGGGPLADGGSMSIVGLGAFWETWRFLGRHFALGPSVFWQMHTSDSMTRHLGAIALRVAYYGGP